LFARSKDGGVWALLQLPIESCRERAADIGAEEYQTEADGARSLVAFVAAQVDPALVERLSPGNTQRLWVEVRPKSKGV
jgi:hypothetical protein